MDDWFNVPMLAINAFERATKLTVSVHEMTGALWSFLPPGRFNHMNGGCVAAKALKMASCIQFDVLETRAALAQKPAGRIQVCHAGMVEWVVPTICDGRLQRVLFAGQRRPGPGLSCARSANVDVHESWSDYVKGLEPVDDQEGAWILESLRQLSARIEMWRMNPPAGALEEADDGKFGNAKLLNKHLVPRQHVIRYFIQERHTRQVTLAQLAHRLHLSESRAGHAVRQACGQSFMEILTQARLRTASGLLTHTDLSVQEVVQKSGFRNLSHFHRVFKNAFGITPHQFRQKSEVGGKERALGDGVVG
jgi:AraC-like DNA-binding protein/ligand-binding sensor protein